MNASLLSLRLAVITCAGLALASMGCSSSDSSSSAATCVSTGSDGSCQVGNDELLPASYRPVLGEDGNVKELKGYDDTEHSVADNTVTPAILDAHEDAPLFTYTPPPAMDTEYSMPVMIAGANVTAAPMPLVTEVADCSQLDYFPAIPNFSELPQDHGCYIVCIKLRDRNTSKTTYVQIPPIIVEADKE